MKLDEGLVGKGIIVVGVVGVGLVLLHTSAGASSSGSALGLSSQDEAFLQSQGQTNAQVAIAQTNARTAGISAVLGYASQASSDAAAIRVAQLQGASSASIAQMQRDAALAGAQSQEYAAEAGAAATIDQSHQNTRQAALAADALKYGTYQQGMWSYETAQVNADAIKTVAQQDANAQAATADANAKAAAATANANASAQKSTGFWGFLGNVASALLPKIKL